MVGQLLRSKARKKLTSLSAKAIVAYLEAETNEEFSEMKLFKSYNDGLRLALAVSVEALTGESIPAELIGKGKVLELFVGIEDKHEQFAALEETSALKSYVIEHSSALAEEDLGGISELFTGHQATWVDGGIQLVHNPRRRGTGKIYTPYDVTAHMSEDCAKALVRRSSTPEDLFAKKILDPAVGSGAFCTQIIRQLWSHASGKWDGLSEAAFRRTICENVIHACDIDSEALLLAKVVFWMSAGCPIEGFSLNFAHQDSLAAGPCTDVSAWYNHTSLPETGGYDCILGNPPYVRVNPNKIDAFVHRNTRNLYGAFVELGLNLLSENGIMCFIVPQGIINSRETDSLRMALISQDARVQFQIFDSVPDFLFDQGKIDSNTNTNINQRTTIITVNRGQKRTLLTSQLLRWRRREERDQLFDHLSQIEISEEDLHDGRIPMLSDIADLHLYRLMKAVPATVADVTSEDGVEIHLPKAIRYFATALKYNLGRPNTLVLKVEKKFANQVRVLLNSNLFYWWWRIMGNGFQIEMKDVKSFPLFPLSEGDIERFDVALSAAEEECKVFKRNAGKDVPNINFNIRQDILQDIDKVALATIGMEPHERVFGCKTNSLHGLMDDLRGYKPPK
jgi:hypothetical protein